MLKQNGGFFWWGAEQKKVPFPPWPGENIHARTGVVVAWI